MSSIKYKTKRLTESEKRSLGKEYVNRSGKIMKEKTPPSNKVSTDFILFRLCFSNNLNKIIFIILLVLNFVYCKGIKLDNVKLFLCLCGSYF